METGSGCPDCFVISAEMDQPPTTAVHNSVHVPPNPQAPAYRHIENGREDKAVRGIVCARRILVLGTVVILRVPKIQVAHKRIGTDR